MVVKLDGVAIRLRQYLRMIPNLMQYFGGAEPVVVLYCPLQGRFGERLVITRLARVQQH